MDSHSFHQGIFPTQGSNPSLLHCSRILYKEALHCAVLLKLTLVASLRNYIGEGFFICCANQFSSVQSLSRVRLFATAWTATCQASLSITNSWSLLKLMSIASVMPSNNFILCHPLFLPSIFPSIRVFSNESLLRIR